MLAIVTAAVALAGCAEPVAPTAVGMLAESRSAYDRGDDAEAIRQANRFLELYPKAQESGEAYYLRGLAEIRAGRPQPAEQDLQHSVELSRRGDLVALANLALGQLAEKRKDDSAAEPRYRAALAALPANAAPADEVLLRLGQVLQRQGQWEPADLQFDRLIYLFPDSSWAKLAHPLVRARAWTVRAGTFDERRHAEALAEKLRQAALTAQIVPLADDKACLAVQVGRFSKYREAGETLAAVRAIDEDAIITTAR